MEGISIEAAWQRRDPKFEADAIALWEKTKNLLPGTNPEDRAHQLSSVAYEGDTLAGVTTVQLDVVPNLRHRFALYRVLINPDFRGRDIAGPIGRAAYRALEAWAMRNPDQKLAGFGSVRQSAHLIDNYRSPYSRATDAVLIGYTTEGHQIRIRWFDHFRPA